MVGENGGGVFLVPYVISVLLFGIPLICLELSTGRIFHGSVLTSFKKINPRIGIFLAIIPFVLSMVVLSYYWVTAGWTLAYFLFSFTGYVDFQEFTSGLYPLVFFLAVIAITGVIVKLGVKEGIERASKIMMPMLGLFLVILAAYAITLPGAAEGLSFYLFPDPAKLLDVNVWTMAFGQAIMSLSVGFGILLTYGSYLRDEQDIPLSAFTIAMADMSVALIAGIVIFPIVFSFGFDPTAGAQLAFVTLPAIFSTMPMGAIIGAAFFILLFVGALTSSISLLEVGVATFVDEFSFSRQKAAFILCSLLVFVGLPSALSYCGFDIQLIGMPFLDGLDLIFGTYVALISAVIICLLVSWSLEPEILIDEINKNSRVTIPVQTIWLLRVVIPVVITVLIISSLLSA